MGAGSWSTTDWASYSKSTASKPTAAIFKNNNLKPSLDPKGIKFRESRDSTVNPNSTAIAVALDVTGSMGMIADYIARTGLGTLFSEILTRKPVTDPHLMFMAVGDAHCDRVPFQVSQFEADDRIITQLTDIFLEGAGGGNNSESYSLPWYFAAKKTSIDCFEKRGKKGYLFTIGDELVPPALTTSQIKQVFGDDSEPMSSEELYKMACRMYNVFHIIVDEGDYARYHGPEVDTKWKKLMGQHVIHLSDYKKLSEVIVSTIQIVEGDSVDSVVKSWSGATSVVVNTAIKNLVPSKGSMKKEVVRL